MTRPDATAPGPLRDVVVEREPGAARTSVACFVAAASSRRPLPNSDGKSGAELELLTVGGDRYVLKHVGGPGDWVARASGDLDCRAVRLWSSGLLDALPSGLDHAIVAAERGPTPRRGSVLQHDVGRWLVPPGDAPLPGPHHRQFLDHMAALHVAFWGFQDQHGLLPLEHRYLLLAPAVVTAERTHGAVPDPLPLIGRGTERLRALAPRAARIVSEVLAAPSLLTGPLGRTPSTLLHGDWKAGNLGVRPDGRTILLDWTLPGAGPPCADLAWYLAINAARLPESKEAAIAAYHAGLRRRGVDTGGWWERQLALSLVGAFVLLGWEKALGDRDELAWWTEHVEVAAGYLGS